MGERTGISWADATMIRRIFAALLRRLFGRRPEPPKPPRTIPRDELERLVMRYRRELGKRVR